ncbi:MAG: tail fiber domain-containing protein, partial [Bacteroidia bacterium]
VINPTANNMVNIGDHSITSIKGQVAFGTYSDGRVKDNIKEDVPGLAFITQLRPVTYNYDLDKEIQLSGGKKTANWDGKYDIEKIKFSGFIAQEVEASAKKIGYDFSGVDKPKNDKDLYSLRYSDFVVPLVKSVQELNTENEKLKAKVETLSEDNKEMKAELDKIKSMLEVNVK